MSIIKAIWDELFLYDDLRDAVLSYAPRNVASYSLLTLAVHDLEVDTMFRLLEFAMDANQQITLSTYHCIVQRLEQENKWAVVKEQRMMIGKIWNHSVPLLENRTTQKRSIGYWFGLMMRVCSRFRLIELKARINSFFVQRRFF